MKKSKKQLLELIDRWLAKFPCNLFFDTSFICIAEFIRPEELLNFIEKKYKQYKQYKNA